MLWDWRALPEVDDSFRHRRDEAEAAGLQLRYVASLAGGRARVDVFDAHFDRLTGNAFGTYLETAFGAEVGE